MNKGLSIRSKILLLLTAVPMLSLGLFLVVAIGIFENDKVAYIFESSATVSKTLSSQVRTDLNASLLSAKPMMQEFIQLHQFGPLTTSLLSENNYVSWVAAIKSNNGQLFKAGLSMGPQPSGPELNSIRDIQKLILEADAQKRIVRLVGSEDHLIIIEKVALAEDVTYFVLQLRAPEIVKNFRSSGTTQNFLLTSEGTIVLGTPGFESKNINEKMGFNLTEKISSQKIPIGTEELKDQKGESWLVSFSRVNFGGLYVMSLIPKKAALRAIEELIRKSVVLFILILSGVVIVSLIATGTLTKALTALYEATRKVAEGNFSIRVDIKSKDEIGGLAHSFNAMASEVSRLMKETAEKARMESELKTAQTVQETLLPPPRARVNEFNISGHYEPASECGGDWWHYSQVGKKTYLWIGDATGHGAPAALITSAAKSAASIIETLNLDPAMALKLMNQAVFDVSKGRIMMTFFIGCFDSDTGIFSYANASHDPPFLLKKQTGPLSKKHIVPLQDSLGPRLGQSRNSDFHLARIKLDMGDRILFYTDGIAEIQNSEKKSWGERAFIKSILASNQEFPPLDQTVEEMVGDFTHFRQQSALVDDVTFFYAEYQKEA